MKLFTLLALAGLALPSLAAAYTKEPCYKDRIRTSPGILLFLTSGLKYEVYPGDSRISSSWLPLDRLLVCQIGGAAVEITNLDRRNEQIKALRQF